MNERAGTSEAVAAGPAPAVRWATLVLLLVGVVAAVGLTLVREHVSYAAPQIRWKALDDELPKAVSGSDASLEQQFVEVAERKARLTRGAALLLFRAVVVGVLLVAGWYVALYVRLVPRGLRRWLLWALVVTTLVTFVGWLCGWFESWTDLERCLATASFEEDSNAASYFENSDTSCALERSAEARSMWAMAAAGLALGAICIVLASWTGHRLSVLRRRQGSVRLIFYGLAALLTAGAMVVDATRRWWASPWIAAGRLAGANDRTKATASEVEDLVGTLTLYHAFVNVMMLAAVLLSLIAIQRLWVFQEARRRSRSDSLGEVLDRSARLDLPPPLPTRLVDLAAVFAPLISTLLVPGVTALG